MQVSPSIAVRGYDFAMPEYATGSNLTVILPKQGLRKCHHAIDDTKLNYLTYNFQTKLLLLAMALF